MMNEIGAQPSKEKSEVTRPLTKEEAKLRRQEAQAKATLEQVQIILDKVTETIERGRDRFPLVNLKAEDLAPASLAAVKEVFPFVKLTLVPKTEQYTGSERMVTVEFVD